MHQSHHVPHHIFWWLLGVKFNQNVTFRSIYTKWNGETKAMKPSGSRIHRFFCKYQYQWYLKLIWYEWYELNCSNDFWQMISISSIVTWSCFSCPLWSHTIIHPRSPVVNYRSRQAWFENNSDSSKPNLHVLIQPVLPSNTPFDDPPAQCFLMSFSSLCSFKVVGFMDKPTHETDANAGDSGPLLPTQQPRHPDTPKSNHEKCMELFEKAGYEVRYKVVNPLDVWIPQSRPRIHYQGLCRKRYPNMNHKLAMDALKDTWSRLTLAIRAVDPPMHLEDFLLFPDDVPTEVETPSPSNEPAPGKRQKTFKWETIHAEFRKEHHVTSRKTCRINDEMMIFSGRGWT